ncbi:MAG: hypothetical protein HUK22_06045 [Thermoguttaceae bacterium]|nr:hypothetical protein [Thermoguttaceae bacterium]
MKFSIVKAALHLRLISYHKFLVFIYCCYAGIPWRGFMHDWSKYSPREFFESARFYVGTHSPITECRNATGVSRAWLHHRGRNPHHFEYWCDNYEGGWRPTPIPYKYALEMICDTLAASRAYNGAAFNYRTPLEWWRKRRELEAYKYIHPATAAFSTAMYERFAQDGDCRALKEARRIYFETQARTDERARESD